MRRKRLLTFSILFLICLLAAGAFLLWRRWTASRPAAEARSWLDALSREDPLYANLTYRILEKDPEGIADHAVNHTQEDAVGITGETDTVLSDGTVAGITGETDAVLSDGTVAGITGKTAAVRLELTVPDGHALARVISLELTRRRISVAEPAMAISEEDYQDLLLKYFSAQNCPRIRTDAVMHLKKEDGIWTVVADDALMDALTGGFLTCMKDPYLLTPAEVLSVYLEEFSGLTGEDWIKTLGLKGIFQTGSRTYEDELDRVFMEKVSKSFAWEICEDTGKQFGRKDDMADTAKVPVKITSVDMKAILKDYKKRLLAYASSAESITADQEELSDAAALCLMDAIRETNGTGSDVIEVTMRNDGTTWQLEGEDALMDAMLGGLKEALTLLE